jgi:hypothetical protein
LRGGQWDFAKVLHLPFLDHVHLTSMPLRMTRAQSKSLNASIGLVRRLMAMVLFHHVVQILDLPNLDGRLALGVHHMKRRQIGTAFVDGHRLG